MMKAAYRPSSRLVPSIALAVTTLAAPVWGGPQGGLSPSGPSTPSVPWVQSNPGTVTDNDRGNNVSRNADTKPQDPCSWANTEDRGPRPKDNNCPKKGK